MILIYRRRESFRASAPVSALRDPTASRLPPQVDRLPCVQLGLGLAQPDGELIELRLGGRGVDARSPFEMFPQALDQLEQIRELLQLIDPALVWQMSLPLT
jgi:hypothetical protein